MAYHKPADPADEALVVSAVREVSRALAFADDRAVRLRERRALVFLAGTDKNVSYEAMAEAGGYSVGLVRLEVARARKMKASEQ